MNAVDIIIKKRDGKKLEKDEINYFIQEYTNGNIPDYQASAWAMAVLLNGMDNTEISQLTMAMAHSGHMLDISKAVDYACDKHSTGGVGDKTTLIVQPIVTACGIPVAKMSGRGLGFSGGTIDKLESFPGIQLFLSEEDFLAQLKKYHTVIAGQSKDLAPADGKLYALRDVTGTVPSPALIASSIMSKKLAVSTNAILLDVKVGKGAFMKDLDSAKNLANIMVSIGKHAGRIMKAELSDMNQPLGYAVGNILEVKEAISLLMNQPAAPDLYTHCVDSSAQLLLMAKQVSTLEEARKKVLSVIENGKALEMLKLLIGIQKGDTSYIDHPDKFPQAPFIKVCESKESGFIHEIDAEEVGETSVDLGGGRRKKTDSIDHTVGIEIHHKVGDKIEKGEPLFTVHAASEISLKTAEDRLYKAHVIQPETCEALPQFFGIVE